MLGRPFLARQGLLEDAVPLFANATELPRAGILLAIPAMEEHGGRSVFQRLYRTFGAAFYGLLWCADHRVYSDHPGPVAHQATRELKEYSPQQLGRLLGLDHAGSKNITPQAVGPGRTLVTGTLLEELTCLRLTQQADRVAFLYLDGHVREYSGQEPLSKAKKAQRSVATPATTDTWAA